MDTQHLIDEIYERHSKALRLVAADNGPARMSLWLALGELASRMTEQAQPQPQQPCPPAATTQLFVGEPKTSAITTISGGSLTADVIHVDEIKAKKRMGRPPGSGRRISDSTLDEIADQVEAGLPAAGQLNPDLVAGDDEVTLQGTLRREETIVRQINGQPVRTTRQYVELR
jgi:hypothetical protein